VVSFVYLYGHSWSVLWLYDSLLGLLLSDYIYDDDRFGWGGISLFLRCSLLGLKSLRGRITLRSRIISHERYRLFLRDRLHFQASDALIFATAVAHMISINI
jgi:hypothetical protein